MTYTAALRSSYRRPNNIFIMQQPIAPHVKPAAAQQPASLKPTRSSIIACSSGLSTCSSSCSVKSPIASRAQRHCEVHEASA
ncbi:hypothetical protein Dimus_003402 [Dionaea muscipula]